MKQALLPLLLLSFVLYSCGGKDPQQHSPKEADTGITVPEDAIPEHLKPGSTDTTHSSE